MGLDRGLRPRGARVIGHSRALHEQAAVVVAHDHTLSGLAARRGRGERAVFTNHYAPLMRRGGVNVLGLVAGGDRPIPGSSYAEPWWGTLTAVDMVWQEAEESSDTMMVCRTCDEMDMAVAEGRVAVLLTMEGPLSLEAGPYPETLVNLRTLHRLGFRSVQFRGERWGRLAEAVEGVRASKGLSPFGLEVVQEMNRLGMLIDLAHVPDPDPLFWDVVDAADGPVIDSHRCVREAHDDRVNISDERVKAIADRGGVIGLQFFSSRLGGGESGRATVVDLMRHIDHIVSVAGIDHVGLGPDWVETELVGRSPELYAAGIEDVTKLPRVTEALVGRGYSDDDILKVLGRNFLRVYRAVLR
jgi:membrane dipeptidase